jgi:hypothetical protein
VLAYQAQDERAAALLEEGLTIARGIGSWSRVGETLCLLGLIAQRQSCYDEAARFYRDVLALEHRGREVGLVNSLEGLGAVAAAQGTPERAARLLGAAEALREVPAVPRLPRERVDFEAIVATLRATMGEPAFAVAWAEGRAMSLAEAMEYALEAGSALPHGREHPGVERNA